MSGQVLRSGDTTYLLTAHGPIECVVARVVDARTILVETAEHHCDVDEGSLVTTTQGDLAPRRDGSVRYIGLEEGSDGRR